MILSPEVLWGACFPIFCHALSSSGGGEGGGEGGATFILPKRGKYCAQYAPDPLPLARASEQEAIYGLPCASHCPKFVTRAGGARRCYKIIILEIVYKVYIP